MEKYIVLFLSLFPPWIFSLIKWTIIASVFIVGLIMAILVTVNFPLQVIAFSFLVWVIDKILR